MGADPDLDVKQ